MREQEKYADKYINKHNAYIKKKREKELMGTETKYIQI